MDPTPPDPHAMADRVARIRRLVDEASAEATSEDHAVTVVAGPAGAVRDLTFSHRAFQLSGRELGETIVRTIREANTAMSRELAESMAEITGSSAPVLGGPLPTPAELRAQMTRTDGDAQ